MKCLDRGERVFAKFSIIGKRSKLRERFGISDRGQRVDEKTDDAGIATASVTKDTGKMFPMLQAMLKNRPYFLGKGNCEINRPKPVTYAPLAMIELIENVGGRKSYRPSEARPKLIQELRSKITTENQK